MQMQEDMRAENDENQVVRAPGNALPAAAHAKLGAASGLTVACETGTPGRRGAGAGAGAEAKTSSPWQGRPRAEQRARLQHTNSARDQLRRFEEEAKQPGGGSAQGREAITTQRFAARIGGRMYLLRVLRTREAMTDLSFFDVREGRTTFIVRGAMPPSMDRDAVRDEVRRDFLLQSSHFKNHAAQLFQEKAVRVSGPRPRLLMMQTPHKPARRPPPPPSAPTPSKEPAANLEAAIEVEALKRDLEDLRRQLAASEARVVELETPAPGGQAEEAPQELSQGAQQDQGTQTETATKETGAEEAEADTADTAEVASLKIKVINLEAEKNHLQASERSLQQELDKAVTDFELWSSHKDNDLLRQTKTNQILEAELKAKREREVEMVHQAEAAQGDLQDLQEQLAEQERVVQATEARMADMAAELEDLRSYKEQMKAYSAEVEQTFGQIKDKERAEKEQFTAEKNALKVKLAGLEAACQDLEAKLQSAHAEQDRLAGEARQGADHMARMEEEFDATLANAQARIGELEGFLCDAQEELKVQQRLAKEATEQAVEEVKRQMNDEFGPQLSQFKVQLYDAQVREKQLADENAEINRDLDQIVGMQEQMRGVLCPMCATAADKVLEGQ